MVQQTLKTLGIFILAIALFSCKMKPSSNEAIVYNDKIVTIHGSIMESVEDITAAYDATPAELQAAYKTAIAQATQAIDQITRMGPLEAENPSFYDAALKYLNMHKQLIESQYKQVEVILSKAEATDEDFAVLEKLVQEADEQYSKNDDEFDKAQQAFAKEYGFEIEK